MCPLLEESKLLSDSQTMALADNPTIGAQNICKALKAVDQKVKKKQLKVCIMTHQYMYICYCEPASYKKKQKQSVNLQLALQPGLVPRLHSPAFYRTYTVR